MGDQAKNPTRATRNGESVSTRTSHPRVVICIQRAV